MVSPADTTFASGDRFALATFQSVQASSCSAPIGAGSLIGHNSQLSLLSRCPLGSVNFYSSWYPIFHFYLLDLSLKGFSRVHVTLRGLSYRKFAIAITIWPHINFKKTEQWRERWNIEDISKISMRDTGNK